MTRADVIPIASLGLLVGILISSFLDVPSVMLFGIFLLAPFIFIAGHSDRRIAVMTLLLFSAALGATRFNSVAGAVLNNSFEYSNHSVRFEGIVDSVDERTDRIFIILRPKEEKFNFRVRVRTGIFTPYAIGERIIVEGTLEQPENFDGFDYRGWLAKEGISYLMYDPLIEKTGIHEKNPVFFLGSIQAHLYTGLTSALSPPHSSLYGAMVLGNRGMMTDDMREGLQKAGLSHIVAISGLHIVIFLGIILWVGLWARLWRGKASYIALFVIAFYIMAIGAPASAVRAGIMGATVLAAERTGRPNSPWRALILAAALMAVFNPLLPRYDVGFQLSFAAVAGILLLAHRIEQALWYVPRVLFPFKITRDRPVARFAAEHEWGGGRGLLAMTLAAQVFTVPLALYHFGTFSPWSPITNLLVVPVLPVALVAGLAAAVGGMIGGVVGTVAAAPAWVLSVYIWGVVDAFSAF